MATEQTVAAPGTELLVDESHGHLQHARKGDGHILLIPQPSLNDHNDPLRWSTVKKWVVSPFENVLSAFFQDNVHQSFQKREVNI